MTVAALIQKARAAQEAHDRRTNIQLRLKGVR